VVSPKNPRTDLGPLSADASDFVEVADVLHRIHRTTGAHRQRWNEMRTYGPLRSARWDPHEEPSSDQPTSAVCYAAIGHAVTAFAEVFQSRRSIPMTPSHSLTAWIPTRPLRLLDLTPPERAGEVAWAVRGGAAGSLFAANKDVCRAWARAIRAQWPELDGLHVPSTVTLQPMVVLYVPAADSFPAAPEFTRPLDHPGLSLLVEDVAERLHWPVR
jgi:hypothetical protein